MILDGANFAEGYVGQGSGAVWRTEPLAAKRAKGARPTAAGGCQEARPLARRQGEPAAREDARPPGGFGVRGRGFWRASVLASRASARRFAGDLKGQI